MKTIKWVLAVLSLGVLGTALVHWQAAAGLQRLNEKLRIEHPEAVEQPKLSSAEQEEITRLQNENRDLLKLRNEVRQLREQARDLGGAQAENRRLRQATTGTASNQQTTATPTSFTSREALADVGTATPEAAVQTFLWAMRDGNMEKFLQTVSPRFLPRNTGNMTEDRAQEFLNGLQNQMQEQMKTFSNFRIVGQDQQRPDKVVVLLQSSTSSSIARITARLYGNEWRVEDPF